jgi:hypothetical protein
MARRRNHQRGGVVLAVLGIVLCIARQASAAPPADVDIVSARFGFCDGLVPERWTPIVLTIASQREFFSGNLVVSYQQDASQTARVAVPVATTPGLTTSVEVVVCVPEAMRSLEFEFTDDATGRTRVIEYTLGSQVDPDHRDLGSLDVTGRRLVLVDPPRSLESSFSARAMDLQRPELPTQGTWTNAQQGTLRPASMPLTWVAYDAADVVVVSGDLGLRDDNQVDPRAMEALMVWVRSGGRLVVLVEAAGEGWRRFLDQRALVEIEERGDHPVPKRASMILRGDTPGRDVVGVQWGKEELQRAGGEIAPAKAMPSRMIHLLEEGSRLGWTVEYSLDSTEVSSQVGADGAVASGPVGLGMVTLMSFDPSKAASIATSVGATRLWRDVLTPMLEREHDRRLDPSNAFRPGRWNAGLSSGYSPETRSAISQVLSEMTAVPRLGLGAFLVIAVVVVTLALLVGPVDAIVLKRRGLRQHSWLSALAWICLASVASLVVPGMVRSGENRSFRIAEYDAMIDDRGTVALAAREGMTSVIAGGNGRIRLVDSADGAVHRGVSPMEASSSRHFGGATLTLHQGVHADGTLRGITPMDTGVRQWSVRAMMDEAPAVALPSLASLQVAAQREGAWRVSLQGLPTGAAVVSMAIETSDGWWTLAPDSPGAQPGVWTSSESPSITPPALWGGGLGGPQGWRLEKDLRSAWIEHPIGTLSLPLTQTRRDAISRYVRGGSWACVYIHASSWPPDVALAGTQGRAPQGWNTMSQAVLRLILPIEHRAPVLAPTEAPSNTPEQPAKEPSTP